MTTETRTSVRNAGWLLVQQAAQVASGFLYTLLVPRTMGAEVYGQYALIASLSLWFVLGSKLGITQVLGRYAPELGSGRPLAELMGRLLTVQLAVSALAAGGFLLATRLWLAEIDSWVLALIAFTILVRTVSGLYSALLYGVNRASHWGMSQVLRGWLTLGGLVVGFQLDGLRGAAVGLLLTELLVLGANLRWTRPHIGWLRPRLDVRRLSPYVGFALVFAATELLGASSRRSGEVMLRLLALPYADIGYFGLAYDIAAMGSMAFAQVAMSFIPLCVALRRAGQDAQMTRLTEGLLKALAAFAMALFYATLRLGPVVVPAVLGQAFAPVAAILVPLVLTLATTALGSLGRLTCIVWDCPRIVLTADLIGLACLWGLGVPLALWLGGLGTGVAVAASSLAALTYTYWRLGAKARGLAVAWGKVVLLGLVGVPLCLIPARGVWMWLLFALVVLLYAGALLATRLVTRQELAALWDLLRARHAEQLETDGRDVAE